jgi:O-acetyl-ADP-ribose deacetylase (regulator of RNase III)
VPAGAVNRIEVVRTDITVLPVDAIVNAANERMLGGGGVDGAIHRAAGPGLLAECRRVPEVRPGVRCPPGEARITGGHGLKARHVIHTVGPVWRGGGHGETDLLRSCYRVSLALAAEHGIRSIAFPAIGCGAYGYPVEQACRIAVEEATRFLGRSDLPERVLFAALEGVVYDAYSAACGR